MLYPVSISPLLRPLLFPLLPLHLLFSHFTTTPFPSISLFHASNSSMSLKGLSPSHLHFPLQPPSYFTLNMLLIYLRVHLPPFLALITQVQEMILDGMRHMKGMMMMMKMMIMMMTIVIMIKVRTVTAQIFRRMKVY